MKDRMALAAWLRSRASLAQVEGFSRYGIVENDRFTENARRAFTLIWMWSTHRFEGEAGRRQDRFYARCGAEALDRRIARANAWAEKMQR